MHATEALALAAALWLAAPAAQDARAVSAPAAADDGFGPDATVFRGAGYVLAATRRDASPGTFGLQAEVEPGVRAVALGGRSASAELTLDCGLRQAAVRDVRVFAQPRLTGETRALKPSQWFHASPVDLFDLTQALCGDAPAHALGPPPPVAPPAVEPPPSLPQAGPAATVALQPPIGTRGAERWIQLGAFGSGSAAEAGWTRLRAAAPALAGQGHRLEPVSRGGGRLFRLLAGPYASGEAAAEACAAARGAGAACLVR